MTLKYSKTLNPVRAAFLFFCLNFYHEAFAQSACDLKLLAGKWKMISLIHWGVYYNVDSLKALSESYNAGEFSTIEFNIDSTCIIRPARSKKIVKSYYLPDPIKCELIFNRNRKRLTSGKYQNRSNWEIIHIDSETLVYKEDNNPKSYATHVLLRR